MKNFLRLGILIALLAISGWSFAQSTIDFETVGNNWTWNPFENGVNQAGSFTVIANPNSSGINTSATCGKMVVNADGAPWAGVESKHGTDLGAFTFDATNSIIKIMVYKSVISNVGIKFSDPSGWSEGELKVPNTKINQWEELTFDFSARIGHQSCDQIVIFPDFSDPRTAGSTCYFDNIRFSNGSMQNDTEAPTEFTATLGSVTSGSVQLLLNATDNSGDVKYFVTYGATTVSVSGLSGVEKSFVITGLTPSTDYSFSVVAKDLSENAAANNPIVVTAKTPVNTDTPCSGSSTVSSQGEAFASGYTYSFTTIGTDVTITFECLDTKVGLVAYLWDKTTGFSESMMTNSLGQVFTKKMTGLTVGANITVACKFAFAGGMSVTKDFTYKVGDNCGIIPPVGLSFPIDFETGSYTFTDFDGGGTTVIDNPQVAGLNTSLKVGQMIKSAGATWGGSWIDYGSDIDFSTMKTIKMKVYSPRVGAKVLFKVENAGDAGKSYEVEATTTTANAWEQLTFDYSAINMANAYQHIVLIFDNGTVGDGSADFTYLFDDIDLVDNSGGLTQINLPVNFESTTVDYTLTDFGGNSSVLGADPENAANQVAITTKGAGSETWAGTTIGKGLGFKTLIPFTATSTKISVRVYSPAAGIQVRLKVEDHTNTGITAETEATTTLANTWETLIFDFSNVAAGTNPFNLSNNFDKMSIFFNFGVPGTGEIYYFDDVTFVITTAVSKHDRSAITVYPNPVKSELFVDGLPQNATIKIFDAKGKLLVNRQDDNKRIDVNNLAKGVYTLQVSDRNSVITKKFIKE